MCPDVQASFISHHSTIPPLNPHPQFQGLEQKMTMATGEAKQLQQVLEKQGLDVQELKAKCKTWLTGRAAENMVRTRRQHRGVSERAMMAAIENVCVYLVKIGRES